MSRLAHWAPPVQVAGVSTRRRLKAWLVGQFGRPHGPLGALAGWIMRTRSSNRKRNLWTVDLMQLRPDHRVLEIGYGPGYALQHVCDQLSEGSAVGLDHSETMFRMASARNRRAVDVGRLRLFVGAVERLDQVMDPALDGPFDRIYAVNVVMFWSDPVAVLRNLSGRLADGGRLLLTFQPRFGDRSEEGVLAAADRLAEQMCAAGLVDVEIETLPEVSPMAVCVIGCRA